MNEETTLISVPIRSVAWPWSPSEESWSPTLCQASLQHPAREIPALCISSPLLCFQGEFHCKSKHCLFIHASMDAYLGGFQVFL